MKLYKRISLLLTMGIMGIGIITFKFSPAEALVNDNKANISGAEITPELTTTPTPDPTPTPTSTPAPTPTPAPNNLTELDSSNEFYQLVVSFLNAKLTCDKEEFADIVSDISYIDEAQLQFRSGTIVEYKDIKCYSKTGSGIIDYVVYYTYYSDIATIDTDIISIDKVNIYKDETGKYRIYIGGIDDETQEFLRELDQDADVQELIQTTSAQMAIELDSDENLLKYFLRIYNNVELDEDDSEATDLDMNLPDDDSEEDGEPLGD